MPGCSARRPATICSTPRGRGSPRCARRWRRGSNWARWARWWQARDQPACFSRLAPTGRWTWPCPYPARACAGRWPASPGRDQARPLSPRGSDLSTVKLISLEKAAKAYAHRSLLDGVSLGVSAGDRIGVVGRNGAGKTTLLAALAGTAALDSGRVTHTRGLRLGYLPQGDYLTGRVRELVFGTLPEHAWAADPRTRAVSEALLGGVSLDFPAEQLSGGERRRVGLAAVLCGTHDLLLLDEPTNHLDIEAISWLA